MFKIIFAIYNSKTGYIEVSLYDKIHVSFDCQKCNASVHLDAPSDIAYLTRLAREEPGLYAKLAAKKAVYKGMLKRWGVQLELPYVYITFLLCSFYFFNKF